jgi:hypothetical protein
MDQCWLRRNAPLPQFVMVDYICLFSMCTRRDAGRSHQIDEHVVSGLRQQIKEQEGEHEELHREPVFWVHIEVSDDLVGYA